MKMETQHVIINKYPAQEIFYLAMWSEAPSCIKVMLSRMCLSPKLGMIQFCNISAYVSLIILTVSRPELHISSKIKGPNNDRCSKSTPLHDFLTVQWSLHISSRIFNGPNSAVVRVDKTLKYEMDFVSPQLVRQPIFIFCHLLKCPHCKCSQLHKIARQQFMMTLNFVWIA